MGKLYTFQVGGIPGAFQVAALNLHTALYRIGLDLERSYKHGIQPGLTIVLKEVKNAKESRNDVRIGREPRVQHAAAPSASQAAGEVSVSDLQEAVQDGSLGGEAQGTESSSR